MKSYTITINQNVLGKERQITKFEFENRKTAFDSFKTLKETCKIMSEKNYTIMRVFKDNKELVKFNWEDQKLQSHYYKNDMVCYYEVYDKVN